jgi:hypothetical protein
LKAAPWSVADLVVSRRLACALLVAGLTQATLVYLGWPGWPCPVQAALGLPCPGCGLSRATAALLHGEWRAALTIHPFVFLALGVVALAGVGAFAPSRLADRVARAIRALEIRTRATFILVTAFLLYGLVRLAVVAVPIVERAFL